MIYSVICFNYSVGTDMVFIGNEYPSINSNLKYKSFIIFYSNLATIVDEIQWFARRFNLIETLDK